MMIVFTITEISYLMLDLFSNLVFFCDFKIFGCVVCFNSVSAKEGVITSTKVIQIQAIAIDACAYEPIFKEKISF